MELVAALLRLRLLDERGVTLLGLELLLLLLVLLLQVGLALCFRYHCSFGLKWLTFKRRDIVGDCRERLWCLFLGLRLLSCEVTRLDDLDFNLHFLFLN